MHEQAILSAEKQALLELRLKGAARRIKQRVIPRRPVTDHAPMSFAQLYIWAGDQVAPGNPGHNLPIGFRIKGELDIRALENSFNALVRRHEILRTSFSVKDGEPVQVIHPECHIGIAMTDLGHLQVKDGETRVRQLALQESVASFDLSRLPLIRVSLYRLANADHVLLINLHHSVADGLSIGPLLNELDALYGAFRSGIQPNLPELPVQYADFACWQRQELGGSSYPDQVAYWRAQMQGRLRPIALPFDRVRPMARSFKGANVFFSIPQSLVGKLNSLAGESGSSWFSNVLALLQLLLYRCSGSEDILILTPIANRTPDEVRSLIGDFLNLVPLRCDVSGNPTFRELLRRSRETTLGALSNKDLPFDRIVERIKIDTDSDRTPIFQVLLEVLPASNVRLADLEIESYQIDLGFSQFDLSLHLYERADGYLGRFDYSTDVFNAETIEKLSRNFLHLLEAVAADANQPIATISLQSALERKVLHSPERASQEAAYIAPHNDLEERIARIWGEMLNVEQVSARVNFFDLGAHSLLLLKVCDRLRAELGRELKVVDLFAYPTVEALAKYLGDEKGASALADDVVARMRRRSGSSGQTEPIAIVSMAGRLPGARDIESFWMNLREGKESIATFSKHEMQESGVPEAVLSDPNYVGALGYLEDADKFDAAFFGYSAREAETTDPQQRLLLECAAETLERAGYDPDRYQGLIGVYAGSSMNAYLKDLLSQHNPLGSPGWMSTSLAGGRDFLTTRLSYKLNLRGPSVNVQTACSTSLVALHHACRALWDHECDMALAGGVSVTIPLKSGSIYMQEGMYSPDGHCRAFDAGANGTVGGNGVALVLLKRLSDAMADGDHIHAVILGTAINNDGSARAGYTAPGVEGQAQVIALAQAAAQVDPDTIGYVEAHGTGTLLGDPIEVSALTRVFGDGRHRGSPCWIGSVKTNIGHLDVAAGVSGLIKAALQLEHKELVPSLHFSTPNPQIDFTAGPFKVNTYLRQWDTRKGTPRRAGVSSFGFGGTNAHAVLEEAPVREASGPSREWQLLCLSAKTDTALAQATANLARHLNEHPDINLADAAFTLQVGRREFAHRCVVVCRDAADAASALQGESGKRAARGIVGNGNRSVVFMFPGQGAQYPNMGLGLYRTEAVFREAVDYCCGRLKSALGLDLREVLFPAEEGLEAAAERLKQTELTQPALFVIEYALAKLWMALGVQPAAMIGHSVGEYVAACLAGVMSLEDALDLVAERGRLMGQLPQGAMLAVPLEEAQVLPLLGERVSLASVNSPALCVVSGPQADVAALETRLIEMGLAPRRLHTSHAFHSSMMDPILEPFARRVSRIALNPPRLPYLSNVTGQWISAEQATDPAYYATHLRQAVQFSKGLEQLFADANRVLLEVGPGHTLTNLARRHPGKKAEHAFVASMRQPSEAQADEAALMDGVGRLWLAGVRPDWQALHAGGRRQRVCLPTYPYQRHSYWIHSGKDSGPVVPGARERKSDISKWAYVPSWKRTLSPADVAERAAGPSRWLLFADERGWAGRVAARLAGKNDFVVTVHPGQVFAQRGEDTFCIDPGTAEHYELLFTKLRDQNKLPSRIVHFWALTAEAQSDRCFWSPVCVAKALGRVASGETIEITFVSEGVQELTGEETLHPTKAMLLGPCQVIPQEYPGVACRSVDVVLPETGGQRERVLLDQLCAELRSPCNELLVAYRGNHRWVRSYEPANLSADRRPSRLRKNGVYLITGGLGGIGLALAKYLAKSLSACLILVGRTPLPEATAWDHWLATHAPDDPTSKKVRDVRALEEAGAQVMVAAADVANRNQMETVVRMARKRFGGINGIVHAAGVPAGGIIQLKTPEAAAEILASKVQGTMVLDDLFADAELDFVVLCSSLSSVLGGAGQVDYTAANAFLDAYALARAGIERRLTVSIGWDSWNEAGMAVKTAESSKISALRQQDFEAGIRNAEGIEVFDRVLTHSMPQVLVSTRDLQIRLDQWRGRATNDAGDGEASASAPASHGHSRPDLSSLYEPPRTQAERSIADMWAKLLGIDQVGIHDNFFELGGDSVLSIQMLFKLRATFGLDLSLRNLIERPTIAKLSEAIDALSWSARRPVSGAESREQIEI